MAQYTKTETLVYEQSLLDVENLAHMENVQPNQPRRTLSSCVENFAKMNNSIHQQLEETPFWAQKAFTVLFCATLTVGFILLQVYQIGCMHIRLKGIDAETLGFMDFPSGAFALFGIGFAAEFARRAAEASDESQYWTFVKAYTVRIVAVEILELAFLTVILLSRAIWVGLNV